MTVNLLNAAEIQLLLACARTQFSPEQAKNINDLARAQIDWPRVCHLASRHGVQPLFYRTLKAICPDAVPGDIAEQLGANSRLSISRSLYQTAELHRVFTIFREEKVHAIAFKGPTLGHLAYGDPALRESGDLDIVVHEQDIQAARNVLTAHEYQEVSGMPDEADPAETSAHPPRYNVFVHSQSRIIIDLQQSLEGPHFSFALNDPKLWARVVPVELAGQTVSSFCRDDLLILLCVHGTKDVWPQLKWICDLMQLMGTGDNIDWSRLLDRASELHARRRLLLGAYLVHDLLGVSQPDRVLQEARRSRSLVAAAKAIMQRLFISERQIGTKERVSLYLRTDDNVGEQAKRCIRYLGHYMRVITVPSESDRTFLRLPEQLSFGYFIIRPIRLFLKYALHPRQFLKALRDRFRSFG